MASEASKCLEQLQAGLILECDLDANLDTLISNLEAAGVKCADDGDGILTIPYYDDFAKACSIASITSISQEGMTDKWGTARFELYGEEGIGGSFEIKFPDYISGDDALWKELVKLNDGEYSVMKQHGLYDEDGDFDGVEEEGTWYDDKPLDGNDVFEFLGWAYIETSDPEYDGTIYEVGCPVREQKMAEDLLGL